MPGQGSGAPARNACVIRVWEGLTDDLVQGTPSNMIQEKNQASSKQTKTKTEASSKSRTSSSATGKRETKVEQGKAASINSFDAIKEKLAHANVRSLCNTPETHMILYINYISMFKIKDELGHCQCLVLTWPLFLFTFFKKFHWHLVDWQCCAHFCSRAKGFSYTHIHSFSDSFPI